MNQYPDPYVTVTSNSHNMVAKAFQINRTDTVARLAAVLPGDSTLVCAIVSGAAASNAGTTANISVGTSSATPTNIINAQNVLAAGLAAGAVIMPVGANGTVFNQPLMAGAAANTPFPDQEIWVRYAETGTASTAGGPWTVTLLYYR